MINFIMHWHPQFSLHSLGELGVLYLSENKQTLLTKADFDSLNQIVKSTGKQSDYIFQSENITEQIERLEQTQQLLQDGVFSHDPPSCHNYCKADFSISVDDCLVEADSLLYWLSALPNRGELSAWFAQLDLPAELAVVVTDDYLDPRLATLNDQFKRRQRDWLLVKLGGEQLLLGPYFSPSDSSAPCYTCLYDRLVRNHPVREWLRRYTGSPHHQELPFLFDKGLFNNVLPILEQYLKNKVFGDDYAHRCLYSIAITGKEVKRHSVAKRPQCPCCGDANIFQRSNYVPVILENGPKHKDVDGGYRSLARSDTLKDISPCISPITGLISDITEISPKVTNNERMAIYRASYFQNTYDQSQLTEDTFVQLSLGKGVAKDQARSSALGEALERLATQYTGEEAIVCCVPTALDHRSFTPHELTPYSDGQYQYFSNIDGISLLQPQWVKPYNPLTPLHWTRAWSLSCEQYVYVPAAYCFANTPFDDHVHSLYNHNGNAAGNTREEAILQGALEVIERDATAIWWYNKIPRPAISLDIIPQAHLQVIEQTLSPDWEYWLLDISNDIPVVSCAAVGQHKKTGEFMLGFGTHLDPSLACQRALTEMYQLIVVKDNISGPFDFKTIEAEAYLFPRRKAPVKTLSDFWQVSTNSIKEDILYVLEVLKKHGLELCVVDYSRADICLKTLKVIIPGMCHFWPQFANQRLYAVPVNMGWLSKPLGESELNLMPLYL